MYVIYNKSSFGVDIDKTHIKPKETKKIGKISDLSHLDYLKTKNIISVYFESTAEDTKVSKSNEKKNSRKSDKDTINYINDEKESNDSTVIDNNIKENLGDEE